MWEKFKKFCLSIWKELKDVRTLIIFMVVVVIGYSPVWAGYLLFFLFKWKWCAIMATGYLAFWAGPFTPFFPLCIAVTLFIKRKFFGYHSLRKATPEEFEKIKSFYWNLIDTMQSSADVIGWKKKIYPSDEMLAESLNAGELYVLDGKKEYFAAVILNNSHNEGYEGVKWNIDCTDDEVLVPHALAVNPDMQGKGIGKKVVGAIIDIAKTSGKKAVRLDILVGNIPAEKLYTSMGFKYVATKQMYYADTGWTEYAMYEFEVSNSSRR